MYMMEDCDIGKSIDDACHKTHCTRNQDLKSLSELDINTPNVLNAGNAEVCFHYELKISSVFERRIYSTDTKTVKGRHNITFDTAKMLDAKDIPSIPRFQLCRLCFEEA